MSRAAWAVLLLAPLLLPGCVAETVERRRPRKGPVKEVGFVDQGGGQVRYSTEGWSWFVAGRRRHAKRLMRKNCGKNLVPVVVDEYDRQDADVAYSGDDITLNIDRGMEHFQIRPFRHLAYECAPPSAPIHLPRVSTGTPKVVVPPREAQAPPSVSTTTVPTPPAPPATEAGVNAAEGVRTETR